MSTCAEPSVLVRTLSSKLRGRASSCMLEYRMETTDINELMVSRLIGLISREGGHKAVAQALGASDEYLRQITRRYALPSGKTRGLGPGLRKKLDRVYPGWMEAQHPSEGAQLRGGVAQLLSEPAKHYRPLTWGDLMQVTTLPTEFVVEMHDDSMAPDVHRGDAVLFSTRETPMAGDGVLVRDRTGQIYFRRYRQRRPGVWSAEPVSSAYMALDSDADGLEVLAVMVGIPRVRWGRSS